MPELRNRSRRAALEDYLVRLRRMGGKAEAHALMTESYAIREVFAHGVTSTHGGTEQVKRAVTAGWNVSDFNAEWLAKLARVCALQDFYPDDADFALKALRYANRHLPMDPVNLRFHRLEVELLAEQGCFEEALDRVRENAYLKDLFYGYYAVDLRNPFIRPQVSVRDWLDGFNEPLKAWGLRPITINSGAGKPFDRLGTDPTLGPAPVGPKVTVVMTSYKPEREAFLLSARSILRQSWWNLELIIVDDATPGGFTAVLDEVEAEDSRVRVIRLARNRGTYNARNVGMAAASGQFITGQDADDWSHPDRILMQVRHLQRNRRVPGVVTSAIRTNEQLVRIRRGQNPGRRCEVSFMLRSEIAKKVGGYLPARKAADSEFRQRVSRFAGVEVDEIAEPLYFIRLLESSLSRGDFRPGWSHPTRRAFWNACTYWHRHAEPNELDIELNESETSSPLPVPGRFQIREPGPRCFDVVLVADFREHSGRQRVVLDEAKLLVRHGVKVGILQLESLRFPANGVRPLCEPAQALINSGLVSQVVPTEEAKVGSLVLRDPSVMQFPPVSPSALKAEKLFIVGDEAPATTDGFYIDYLPEDVQTNASHYFGVTGIWVAVGPATARSLVQSGLSSQTLSEQSWPLVFEANDWRVRREKFRTGPPIVGRHSENSEVYWPRRRDDVLQIWPNNGTQEVRILGDARPALRICEERYYPSSWLINRLDEISPRAFCASVDFYVHYTHERWPVDRTREVLEAMAAECVVILTPGAEKLYGRAALYAEPDELTGLIHELRSDWARFSAQAQSGRSYALSQSASEAVAHDLMSLLGATPRSDDGEDRNV